MFPLLAQRLQGIATFHVMELLARARTLEANGRDIIHLELGEPDFPTPEPVIAAVQTAMSQNWLGYTPALGLPALREALSEYYAREFQATVSPQHILLTAGASGALLLALATVLNPGETLITPDPDYPCNRHFARLLGADVTSIAVRAEDEYRLTPAQIRTHWQKNTKGVLLATPANPTGVVYSLAELAAIRETVKELGGVLIVDEIYQGLSYDSPSVSAARLGDDLFVINSFSKYFNMTGWRLGWLVMPPWAQRAVNILQQNLFIAAATPAQYAALAALQPETLAILAQRRDVLKSRRDFLLPALRTLGFELPYTPAGAFYLYANCQHLTDDSHRFAYQVLEEAGVAITPGRDFDHHQAATRIRIAYTQPHQRLEEAVERLAQFIRTHT